MLLPIKDFLYIAYTHSNQKRYTGRATDEVVRHRFGSYYLFNGRMLPMYTSLHHIVMATEVVLLSTIIVGQILCRPRNYAVINHSIYRLVTLCRRYFYIKLLFKKLVILHKSSDVISYI